MSTPRTVRFKRVLMAFDSRLDDVVALEAAVTVAAKLGAETKVVFIEDEEMLRAAEYLTVNRFALSTENLDAGTIAIERAVRIHTIRQCRAFEEVSQRRGLKATSEIRRGRTAAEAIAVNAEADLIVIGRSSDRYWWSPTDVLIQSSLEHSGRPVMLLHPAMPTGGPVAAVYDGSSEADLAIQVAVDLAQEVGGPLEIALISQSPAQGIDQREGLQNKLKDCAFDLSFTFLASERTQELIDWTLRIKASMVVMSCSRVLARGETLEALLDRLPTSILLVR